MICVGRQRSPASSVSGADAERAAEAHERVGPGDSFAALKLADGRAVKSGKEAEVFLADSELARGNG